MQRRHRSALKLSQDFHVFLSPSLRCHAVFFSPFLQNSFCVLPLLRNVFLEHQDTLMHTPFLYLHMHIPFLEHLGTFMEHPGATR